MSHIDKALLHLHENTLLHQSHKLVSDNDHIRL
jgi:hypothetical protein